MKATIKNGTNSPKAFYLDGKLKTVQAGESLPEADYQDGFLQALKNTGWDVDHKGVLKIESAPAKTGKDEAAKIIAEAKAEAEKIIAEAKVAADKMIAEAEELTKGGK